MKNLFQFENPFGRVNPFEKGGVKKNHYSMTLSFASTLPFLNLAPGSCVLVVGGDAMFRGRAVEKLIEGLPRKPGEEFTECPHEDLKEPKRVHLDAYGNVHLCQGLSMGNMWQTSLSELVSNYSADSHPICGPLAAGGPLLLAKEYKVEHQGEYVDACHFCYLLRLALLTRFPQYLAPRQVYGLE